MTLRNLYIAVLLFIGAMAGLVKAGVAPIESVKSQCGALKNPAQLDRELCASYGRELK